jgi:hypothetical protein
MRVSLVHVWVGVNKIVYETFETNAKSFEGLKS